MVVEYLERSGKKVPSRLNPTLYSLDTSSLAARPVTNVRFAPPYTADLFDPPRACKSLPCWNGATGLGSPNTWALAVDEP